MLDNNLGIEPEEIYDCHMYKRKESALHTDTVFVLRHALFYISVFGSVYVQFSDYRYVCSAITDGKDKEVYSEKSTDTDKQTGQLLLRGNSVL